MGFRTGAYAKVWEIKQNKDTVTRIRVSISRKNKQTNEWEQDFSGFVDCIGTATAKNAALLKEGSTIKIGDCDVSTWYNAEKKVTYTNFKVFSFEEVTSGNSEKKSTEPQPAVDDGEVDDSRLPF